MRTQRACVHAWMYLFSQFVAPLLLFYYFFLLSFSVIPDAVLYSVFISISCCFHLFSVLSFCRVFFFSFSWKKNATNIRKTIKRLFRCFWQNLCFECSWKGRANANIFNVSKRIRFLFLIQSFVYVKNK